MCSLGSITSPYLLSSNISMKGFDALLRTTSQDVSLGSIHTVENLSITLWAKLFSVGTMTMTSLKLKEESGADVMSINIAPEISVQVG